MRLLAVSDVHVRQPQNRAFVEGQRPHPDDWLILGGDHLGPSPWRREPAEAAMAKAEALVASFAEAGFAKLHLDASMACAGDPEPLPPDDPLLGAPHLLVVPHIGSATHAARERMAERCVDNLLAALAGRPMPHPAPTTARAT